MVWSLHSHKEELSWRAGILPGGYLDSIETDSHVYSFCKKKHQGPSWYGFWEGKEQQISLFSDPCNDMMFSDQADGLIFTLSYGVDQSALYVDASIENISPCPFQPDKCGIKLGIDTCMERYPEWMNKPFPTMLRCEKTHFWGYLMSPAGGILGLASPDPIASWSLDYNTIWGLGVKWGGHRIHTLNLDLLNQLPLPERHPQDCTQLLPGERRSWRIYLRPIKSLDSVQKELASLCEAPLFELENTTTEPGKNIPIMFAGDAPLFLTAKSAEGLVSHPDVKTDGEIPITVFTPVKPGTYQLRMHSQKGKVSESRVYCRKPWSWYLEQASRNAVLYRQKASTHAENWYGFFSRILAHKHFPDKEQFDLLKQRFDLLYSLMFDEKKHRPTVAPRRLQNTSSMISLLVDFYEATDDLEYLDRAAILADWLIKHTQKKDGSYRSWNVHYTCVIYPAKSIMELMAAEKVLSEKPFSEKSELWKHRYARHSHSVKAAMDDLVQRDGNIDTEGQLTYEDGMVSCTALQLGRYATTFGGDKYKKLALRTLHEHNCLTQIIVPDCRMRGGTLRFWEGQYDVHIRPNFINSPHGWSAWRIYGTWYAYLLTAKPEYLQETMNALGSCVQLIDIETGKLRWAHAVDPFVKAVQLTVPPRNNDPDQCHKGHTHPLKHPHRHFVLGEQYVDMVSDWQNHNPNDNDVHEIFKCLEEVALTNCYVLEKSDGCFESWNCTVEVQDGQMSVLPSEAIVANVHVNIKCDLLVEFRELSVRVLSGQPAWVGFEG